MEVTGKITKNKHFEIEVLRHNEWTSWFYFNVALSRRCDHAGFRFGVELLMLAFYFSVYDIRHWNWEEKRWEVYPGEEDDNYLGKKKGD